MLRAVAALTPEARVALALRLGDAPAARDLWRQLRE